MKVYSIISLGADIILLLIAVALTLGVIYLWKRWARKREAEYKEMGYHYRPDVAFSDWMDYYPGVCIISIICIGAFFVLGAICLCLDTYNICSNRVNEPIYYEMYKVEGETLRDVLEDTEDIVNTVLYMEVVQYNAELTEIKEKSKMPSYSHNFTGEVNWDNIPCIDLKEIE